MRNPKYTTMNRKNKELSKSRNWTDDECIVLVALYSISEFRIGDDNSKENKVLAKSFDFLKVTTPLAEIKAPRLNNLVAKFFDPVKQ